ncbi:UNVERIFIED_CONTAM: hypothetical protein K2H54_024322 [Gekko kuhli]
MRRLTSGLAWSSSRRRLASLRASELESEHRMDDVAPLPPHSSRFLKQKTGSHRASLAAGQTELGPLASAAARPSPSAASQGRANAVLQKLAQIESKLQRRKARLGTGSSAAARQMLMDDEDLSWSKSSQGHAQGAGGLRYLKTDAARPEKTPAPGTGQSKNRGGLGREREDTGHLLDASSKHKRQNSTSPSSPGGKNSQLNVPTRTPPPPPVRRPSPPGRSSLKRLLHRTSSPPSRNTPVPSGGTSPSSSSSINDSLAGRASPKVNGRSFSEGSIIRSLDELFSGAADSQGSSSSDFQVNVLSLADLAPSTASQKEGPPEEATVMETAGSLSTELEQNLVFADAHSALKPPSATAGKAAALEEDPGETEISEQLSGSSVECSDGEQENPTSARYSEDFDSLSENTQRQSSSEDSRDGLDASLQAGLSDPSCPCPPPVGTKRSQSARRFTTKEVAVQTHSSSPTPHGLKTAAATIDWIAEGPTTSHVVSMDTLEELTTYRPAVSVLNDMWKQNLRLIQQFVEASRHLHLSFVALLEEEDFHYHTLEEAKRYIDHHKRPPLTLEQALHELEEQKQVAV